MTGKLTASPTADNKEVGITVRSEDTVYTFTVKVIGSGYDYIGFSSAEKEQYHTVQNELDSFKRVNDIFGTHYLTNTVEGNRLWIVSREPIADMNSLEQTARVRISTFDAPLEKVAGPELSGDGHYYYYCPTKIWATSFDITVDPK